MTMSLKENVPVSQKMCGLRVFEVFRSFQRPQRCPKMTLMFSWCGKILLDVGRRTASIKQVRNSPQASCRTTCNDLTHHPELQQDVHDEASGLGPTGWTDAVNRRSKLTGDIVQGRNVASALSIGVESRRHIGNGACQWRQNNGVTMGIITREESKRRWNLDRNGNNDVGVE